ncbi:MAG: hypothetical protein HQL04_03400 [Nitrospirae bacterium]|nr:hypothetical protein [Nitrospirota bacterium]
MPVNYKVNASVVDIRRDSPRSDDVFMVDTNVWYWLTHGLAASAQKTSFRRIRDYSSYIKISRLVKSKLFRCGLSLAELSHLIEKTEREIFIRSNGNVTSKEYRHNDPSERNRVVSEIQAAWNQIEAMSETLDINIDDPVTKNAMNRLTTEPLDGYDLFVIEAISRNKATNKVITDDGDFATVAGIEVFTANNNVINAAKSQGRLITR